MTTAALPMTPRSRRNPAWPSSTPTVFGIASDWHSTPSPAIYGIQKMDRTPTMKLIWSSPDSIAVGSASWVRLIGTLKEPLTYFNFPVQDTAILNSPGSAPLDLLGSYFWIHNNW